MDGLFHSRFSCFVANDSGRDNPNPRSSGPLPVATRSIPATQFFCEGGAWGLEEVTSRGSADFPGFLFV